MRRECPSPVDEDEPACLATMIDSSQVQLELMAVETDAILLAPPYVFKSAFEEL